MKRFCSCSLLFTLAVCLIAPSAFAISDCKDNQPIPLPFFGLTCFGECESGTCVTKWGKAKNRFDLPVLEGCHCIRYDDQKSVDDVFEHGSGAADFLTLEEIYFLIHEVSVSSDEGSKDFSGIEN